MSDNTAGGGMADVGSVLDAVFGEPAPLSFDANLASWCERTRKELVEYEVQWSDPDWTFLRQMEAHKAALDALREAVGGCGTSLSSQLNCGDRGVFIDRYFYCPECRTAIQTACAHLLGSEIEGDGNG